MGDRVGVEEGSDDGKRLGITPPWPSSREWWEVPADPTRVRTRGPGTGLSAESRMTWAGYSGLHRELASAKMLLAPLEVSLRDPFSHPVPPSGSVSYFLGHELAKFGSEVDSAETWAGLRRTEGGFGDTREAARSPGVPVGGAPSQTPAGLGAAGSGASVTS